MVERSRSTLSSWVKSCLRIVPGDSRERSRLAGGVLVLLLVDVIWVASAELTDVSLNSSLP